MFFDPLETCIKHALCVVETLKTLPYMCCGCYKVARADVFWAWETCVGGVGNCEAGVQHGLGVEKWGVVWCGGSGEWCGPEGTEFFCGRLRKRLTAVEKLRVLGRVFRGSEERLLGSKNLGIGEDWRVDGYARCTRVFNHDGRSKWSKQVVRKQRKGRGGARIGFMWGRQRSNCFMGTLFEVLKRGLCEGRS